MKSKTFKAIIKEVADEMELPELEVRLAIESAYKSMKEDMASVDFRAVKTQEDYDKVLKRTGLNGLGSFKLKKNNYITKVLWQKKQK